MRFQATATPISGLLLLARKPIGDERGYFERLFCASEFRAFGFPGVIAQANHSFTKRQGAVRGMHFQRPPHAEWKIITCQRGKVLDVIVDLRHGSATFLQHHAVELSGDSCHTLVVPPGCAHGFQTLTDDVEMLYLHSHPYEPAAEGGVRADDPRLAISWPLLATDRSERDLRHPFIPADYSGIMK